MPDVEDVLRNLSHIEDAGPAGREVVADDVARGHHAVTRRRRQRFAFAGAFVAVAAAAVVGIGQGMAPVTSSDGVTAAPRTGTQASRLELVAYTGDQPVGFKVNTVPDGWKVVSSDQSSFVVAPPGVKASPAGAGEPVSVADKISVSLQGLSKFPAESPVRKVDINGKKGELGHPLETMDKLSDTWWLFFPGDTGSNVQVQVPASVELSTDQIIAFAEGITVTEEATPIGG
jgi:F0F1-type ATP synthase membrane subunit c/vacuolar-type H+-ATPase subunit K